MQSNDNLKVKISPNKFLGNRRLRVASIDIEAFVKVFTEDMISGLNGKEGALRMTPTFIEAENAFITDTPVLAIDAGGTNFRAAIVSVSNFTRTVKSTDSLQEKLNMAGAIQ
jgi:hexokinase